MTSPTPTPRLGLKFGWSHLKCLTLCGKLLLVKLSYQLWKPVVLQTFLPCSINLLKGYFEQNCIHVKYKAKRWQSNSNSML